MRRIYKKKYKDWSPKIQKQLQKLNRGVGGCMIYILEGNPTTYVTLERGEVIGWASLETLYNVYSAMFYVKKEYRRQGVASKLASRIKSDCQHIPLFSKHDAPAFFKSIGWAKYA